MLRKSSERCLNSNFDDEDDSALLERCVVREWSEQPAARGQVRG